MMETFQRGGGGAGPSWTQLEAAAGSCMGS